MSGGGRQRFATTLDDAKGVLTTLRTLDRAAQRVELERTGLGAELDAPRAPEPGQPEGSYRDRLDAIAGQRDAIVEANASIMPVVVKLRQAEEAAELAQLEAQLVVVEDDVVDGEVDEPPPEP